jgi:ATP-dependent DNA ligase
LLNRPLSRRRELLENLLSVTDGPLRISPLLRAPSGQVLEAVRKLGLEGVVGKRLDSIYEPGQRSGAWIKLRASMEQEFVIGGYIPGGRRFVALLVAVYETRELIFVAKVKNGFVPRIRDELLSGLKALQTAKCPFRTCPRKGLALRRVFNHRENEAMPLGQTKAGLPGPNTCSNFSLSTRFVSIDLQRSTRTRSIVHRES